MRFLIRIVLRFLVVTTLLNVVRGLFAPARGPRNGNTPKPPAPDSTTPNRLVKDPVCGTYVSEKTAIRSGNIAFCSDECRLKYRAS